MRKSRPRKLVRRGFRQSVIEKPTPVVAALVSAMVFSFSYILTGIIWGAGLTIIWHFVIAATLAGSYASAKTNWKLLVIVAALAGFWMFLVSTGILIDVIMNPIG